MAAAPIPKLSADAISSFIIGDFEAAWDAPVARAVEHAGGGNFMFALLAMILLEFACRVCAKDNTNAKLSDFSHALGKIEPRYFTPLPGVWGTTSHPCYLDLVHNPICWG
jgi:hypothetical protein